MPGAPPHLKRIDRTVGELCRKCSPPEHAGELRTVYEVEGHSVTNEWQLYPWCSSDGSASRADLISEAHKM